MGSDDASSGDMRRLPANPDADPLALDDDIVDQLLTGEFPPGQAPPGYAEVATLLAATVAPPTPDELAGQAEAVAELRAATRPRRAVVGTRRAARPPRRRRVGLAAVVLVGALATGGAAGAATGHLPGPVRDAARSIMATVDGTEPTSPGQPASQTVPAPTPASAGGTPGPTGPGATAAAGSGPGSTTAGTTPELDNKGLCKAYLAPQGIKQGSRLDAAEHQALAKLAGGREKITAYCERLLPGRTEDKEDNKDKKEQGPPSDPGQGQGPGPGQPPAPTGGGSREQSGPPATTGEAG
jgi:hypothetical protein